MTGGDPEVVAAWVAQHVAIAQEDRPGWASTLLAKAIVPLSAASCYELLSHPDNAAIFRWAACSLAWLPKNKGEGAPGGLGPAAALMEND